ncbi:MAG: hypothetical protein ABFS56_11505, partial [Pseudomonadota bacterium]
HRVLQGYKTYRQTRLHKLAYHPFMASYPCTEQQDATLTVRVTLSSQTSRMAGFPWGDFQHHDMSFTFRLYLFSVFG